MKKTDEEVIRFHWVPDSSKTPDEVEALSDYLRDRGAETSVENQEGFFGIGEATLIIVVAMGIVQLANSIVDLVKNAKRGGLIYDYTKPPPVIKEDLTLKPGTLILIKKVNNEVVSEVVLRPEEINNSLFQQLVNKVLEMLKLPNKD